MCCLSTPPVGAMCTGQTNNDCDLSNHLRAHRSTSTATLRSFLTDAYTAVLGYPASQLPGLLHVVDAVIVIYFRHIFPSEDPKGLLLQ